VIQIYIKNRENVCFYDGQLRWFSSIKLSNTVPTHRTTAYTTQHQR